MYNDDVKKWLKLSEKDYTPEELKEEFHGEGDLDKVVNVIKIALRSKSPVEINLKKTKTGTIEYKVHES